MKERYVSMTLMSHLYIMVLHHCKPCSHQITDYMYYLQIPNPVSSNSNSFKKKTADYMNISLNTSNQLSNKSSLSSLLFVSCFRHIGRNIVLNSVVPLKTFLIAKCHFASTALETGLLPWTLPLLSHFSQGP